MCCPYRERRNIWTSSAQCGWKCSAVSTPRTLHSASGRRRKSISREGEQIFEGELASLKRFKDDVKEVKTGFECGLVMDGFNDIKEGDIIEAYIMVEVPR